MLAQEQRCATEVISGSTPMSTAELRRFPVGCRRPAAAAQQKTKQAMRHVLARSRPAAHAGYQGQARSMQIAARRSECQDAAGERCCPMTL